jgi:hypothetical protein
VGRRLNLFWLCVALLSASLAACGADSQPSPNPMFERWCDEHPCGWEDRGEVKRVGTWHPDDYAIELISDDAEISQLRAELDSTRTTCLAFSMIAHITGDARAHLELDFLDDAEVEFSERIPRSNWQRRTFTITTPTWYRGVRFIVRKDGPGKVVVAELNVELAADDCTATPLPLRNRPDGASCDSDDQCASGRCPNPELSDGGTCD